MLTDQIMKKYIGEKTNNRQTTEECVVEKGGGEGRRGGII
jgi:hypothetical protein